MYEKIIYLAGERYIDTSATVAILYYACIVK